jgi:hypothetical protein
MVRPKKSVAAAQQQTQKKHIKRHETAKALQQKDGLNMKGTAAPANGKKCARFLCMCDHCDARSPSLMLYVFIRLVSSLKDRFPRVFSAVT